MSAFRLLVLTLTLAVTPVAFGAVLGFGAPRVDGDNVMIPIGLGVSPGETVASLQFELWPNGATLVEVFSGDAALAAGKDVIFADRGDAVAVIVAGLNQNALPSGTIAWAVFTATPTPKPAIANVVLSDPRGQAVEVDKPEPEEETKPPSKPPQDPKPAETATPEKNTPEKIQQNAETGATAETKTTGSDGSVFGGGSFPGIRTGERTDTAPDQRNKNATPARTPAQGGSSFTSPGQNPGPAGYQSQMQHRPAPERNSAGNSRMTRPTAVRTTPARGGTSPTTQPVSAAETTDTESFQMAQGGTFNTPAPGRTAQSDPLLRLAGSAIPSGSEAPPAKPAVSKKHWAQLAILLAIFGPIGWFLYRSAYGKRRRF